MPLYMDTIAHKQLGDIFVYWDDRGKIREITLGDSHLYLSALSAKMESAFPSVHSFLANYGADEKAPFTPEVLEWSHCTPFMKKVYTALFYTKRGTLITYGELAEMAGFPRAFRAVGSAMRKNKYLLAVPCHRVVGSSSLGGFTTGMDHKITLLELEGHQEYLQNYIIDME